MLNLRRTFVIWNGKRFFRQYSTHGTVSVGSDINNFKVESIKEIPELGIQGIKMRHYTGATALHLSNNDPNCVFSVTFRTHPRISHGAPHILEHLVLCGSQNYPVRDPFFKMLNRSLATYMNAWTGRDWTMYPFSTVNKMDFDNLLKVYMDAAWRPLLRREDFRQEGWRLERESTLGQNQPQGDKWKFSGVVYNEMKGAFSDAETVFSTRWQQQMFPGTAYSHVSGGDPPYIPSLSYEELVEFYNSHYHPANSLFYSYGNLDLGEHLKKLDQDLQQIIANRKQPFSPLIKPMEGFTPFSAPKQVEITGSVDPMRDPDRQVKMLISFLTNPVSDIQSTFNMQILSALLLDGPTAPLYKALIESNIGSEYAPGTGYDASLAMTTFSVGLQGLGDADIIRVQETIMKTLEQVKKDGFPEDRINSILHQIQLGLRYHSADFGLGLVQRAASSWVHDICPLQGLSVMDKIANFKEQLQTGKLFQGLIDQLLVDCKHRLTFLMRPEVDYTTKLDGLEDMLVKEHVGSKSEAELENILEMNKKLVESQNKVEDKSTLPCLGISDINPAIESNPFTIVESGATLPDQPKGITVHQRTSSKANGLAYIKAKIPIELPVEKVALLPIISTCLSELGVEGMPIETFDDRVRSTCSGLGISIHQERPSIDGKSGLSLLLSSHSLEEKVDGMLDLFQMSLSSTNWDDVERIRTQITGSLSSISNSVASSGSSFAVSLAASSLSQYRLHRELMSGISQSRVLKVLSENVEEAAKLLKSTRLEMLGRMMEAQVALIAQNPNIAESMHRRSWDLVAAAMVKSQESSSGSISLPKPRIIPEKYALEMPFSTNYVARVYQINSCNSPSAGLSANLSILSRLLTSQFLHREIREKGGAYGASASYSRLDGLFALYSYRDPNPGNTLKVFDAVPDWLCNAVINETDLLESKLAIFGDLDKPQDVANEGLQQFYYNLNDADRQAYRDALMAVSADSLRKCLYALDAAPQRTAAILEEGNDQFSALKFEIEKYE